MRCTDSTRMASCEFRRSGTTFEITPVKTFDRRNQIAMAAPSSSSGTRPRFGCAHGQAVISFPLGKTHPSGVVSGYTQIIGADVLR